MRKLSTIQLQNLVSNKLRFLDFSLLSATSHLASITQFSLFRSKTVELRNFQLHSRLWAFNSPLSLSVFYVFFLCCFLPLRSFFLRLEDVEIIKTRSEIKRSLATLFGPFKESFFLLIFISMCASLNVHIWNVVDFICTLFVKQSLETCEMNRNEWKRKKALKNCKQRWRRESASSCRTTWKQNNQPVTWQNVAAKQVGVLRASQFHRLLISELRHLTWKFNRIKLETCSIEM